MVGSLMLYGDRSSNIPYIDCLFFASGAATQSGLNTIDVNKLSRYQQILLYISACFCTPIFIHGSVVFVRLFWFEKRFMNLAKEARSRSGLRTRTISRRKSEMAADNERDMSQEERGVGNREIRVMRASDGQADGGPIEDEHAFRTGKEGAGIRRSSHSSDGEASPFEVPTTPVQETPSGIVWADHLSTPKDQEEKRLSESVGPKERFPEADKEKSIAFVEAQRNRTEKAKLRIPGPRDFDRGLVPEQIEDQHLDRTMSRVSQDSHARLERGHLMPPAAYADGPGPTTGASVYTRARTQEIGESSGPTPSMHIRNRSRSRTFATFLTRTKEEDEDPMPYLSWTPTIGRNSNFVDLNEEQREELGGIEYRSLKLLAVILLLFYGGFHVLGVTCLAPWINHTPRFTKVVTDVGVNPTWWGFFTAASLFNDLGLTLTPDSMISFQFAVLPLVLGTFLIIIGNTGFPCMLRFVIWTLSKLVPKGSGVWEELRFLLDHPRRCFTLLFPSKANWWLFAVLILLNGIDLIFFIVLDLHDPTVTSIPGGYRFLAGLFQAAATRTAGFAVVNIADLHPAVQVSYLIMMYISIFPIAMSMRQTNVYEERSLGVWAGDEDEDAKSSYLSHHLRRQLSFDLWFVFLGFFLIAIVEGSRLENTNEYAFSLFSVLFEIVSAYGTVGLSLGFPGTNASFSAQFRTLSKLIIIAMQIRGRHRGLPYALDRAILLPSESLHAKENEDATRRARRLSTMDFGAPLDPALSRQGTGLSRRSSVEGEGRSERFAPRRLRRILSGAFTAGPAIREKMS
ncbi:similar to potassium ion transporter [Plenodomus lingam JN3]|uniref:Potassium transport protein n=1 Tax=Leptosphaeria maculans (strain JN3 / isolate v23.1.3 / race Av1-4-5-6-7-8) TaxID=985895 RepID=E5A9B7_LEPMJ|nr:similar to potassium ion transporter [Plenodomus lingam JN3]CBY00258.1 similar to potassium ion transporter [Plenodomus lingam JN3]